MIVLLGLASAAAFAEKERPKFTPGPISTYPAQQTIQKVTVAAQPFRTQTETEPAFGKIDPNRQGVLPVLVLIQNGTDKALSLENLKVELVTPDREHVEATPAADLKYRVGPDRPKVYTPPIPGGRPHVSKKKNPLAGWEIEGRAFTARMLPPNETATGFFYFQAPWRSGSHLYLRGVREAATGNELFYFEIPLQ